MEGRFKYNWRKVEATDLDGDKWSVADVPLGAKGINQVKGKGKRSGT